LGCDLGVQSARIQDDPDQEFSALFAGEKVPGGQLPLTIYEAEDEEEEAGFVAQEILRVREHRPKVQIAVLVRTRAQGEHFGRFLAKSSISHQMLTGVDSKIAEAKSAGNNPGPAPICNSGLQPQGPATTPVTISTIHASKGAEFEVVFVPGLAQGLFPVNQNRLLEDLRLFFVAITRSRYLVYLSYPGHFKRRKPQSRYGTKPSEAEIETGRSERAAPSIFLSILP
jgi:superfamily I DNA/RNA helicase